MIKKIFVFITVIFISVLFAFLQGDFVNAQVGIKISPVKVEELVDPGQTLKSQLKVTNKSKNETTFYVYLRDFKAEGESGTAKLIAPGSEEGYFLATWIDITREGIVFRPNEEKIVPFTINVPANAGPGGYFGAILFGTEPPRLSQDAEERGAGMSIAQQTASLVLLQVKGDVDERANVREFNTDKDFYGTPYNIDFTVRIENPGNVHVKPHGNIIITNMFGKEVDVVKVNTNGGNVLPGSIRRFSKINWEGENGFGRYTATMGLTYGTDVKQGGQGKSSLFAAKDFWIIPWRIVIPVLLGLVITIGLIYLMLRLYKNKAVRKAMEQAGLGRVKYVKKFQGPSPTLHFSLILLVIFVILFLIISAIYFMLFA